MHVHHTPYRIIYGDTDNMGIAYHANYFRWFEIGRTEMLRSMGLSYKTIEARGIYLPVSEVRCKYHRPAHYDDRVVIETRVDGNLLGSIKFDYRVLDESLQIVYASGFTRHACVDTAGRVVKPPRYLKEVIAQCVEESEIQ